MQDVYQDIKYLIGVDVFTHEIPYVLQAMEPWLREKVTDARFWDCKHNTTHIGEYPIVPMTPEERRGYGFYI